MAHLYLLLYRTYLVFRKTATQGVLRRWPGIGRGLDRIKQLIQRHFLRNVHAWVRIQSGLSQGIWMQLRLPAETLMWYGEHEPDVQNAILAVVRRGAVVPGIVFYDIGAYVGVMALGAALLIGDSGRIIAFDGDPENIARLRDHTARNGLEHRLRLVHAAVWSRTAIDGISFRRGAIARSQGGVEADGNRPVLGSGELINVPAITLDDFVAAGAPPPQLVKIDVEGGEYEVLRGGTNLFAHQRPLMIVEVHHQQAAEQITARLNEHQYCADWEIPRENFPRRLFASPAEKDARRLDARHWMRDTRSNALSCVPPDNSELDAAPSRRASLLPLT
jgi:FkbM family methyltransferase